MQAINLAWVILVVGFLCSCSYVNGEYEYDQSCVKRDIDGLRDRIDNIVLELCNSRCTTTTEDPTWNTRKPIVPEPDYFIQSSVFTDPSTGKRKVFLVPLQLDNRKGKWEQNRILCRGEGAEMVMVHSNEENNFLHSFLRGNDIKMLPPGAWLGAQIVNRDTNFKWYSGQKPNYVGVWAPGEPNDGGTSCLNIGYQVANNFWWNYPCADLATLMVCQMDLN